MSSSGLNEKFITSLPALGAWIEIITPRLVLQDQKSCSLHWERGLKFIMQTSPVCTSGRSLHWERGLKLLSLSLEYAA